jgi:hypothetical protein
MVMVTSIVVRLFNALDGVADALDDPRLRVDVVRVDVASETADQQGVGLGLVVVDQAQVADLVDRQPRVWRRRPEELGQKRVLRLGLPEIVPKYPIVPEVPRLDRPQDVVDASIEQLEPAAKEGNADDEEPEALKQNQDHERQGQVHPKEQVVGIGRVQPVLLQLLGMPDDGVFVKFHSTAPYLRWSLSSR